MQVSGTSVEKRTLSNIKAASINDALLCSLVDLILVGVKAEADEVVGGTISRANYAGEAIEGAVGEVIAEIDVRSGNRRSSGGSRRLSTSLIVLEGSVRGKRSGGSSEVLGLNG